jgi:hypothetical protein
MTSPKSPQKREWIFIRNGEVRNIFENDILPYPKG